HGHASTRRWEQHHRNHESGHRRGLGRTGMRQHGRYRVGGVPCKTSATVMGGYVCRRADRRAASVPADPERASRRGGQSHLPRGRQARRGGAGHGGACRARCGAVRHPQRASFPARRAAAPRQSGHEDEARQAGARAFRGYRHHLAVELSFLNPAVETLAALVTGNAVMLKPSEFTPLIALELQRLLHAAGLNPDLMQVLVGEGPAGAALIESLIDKVMFTGSVATGRRVAEAAAKKLLPMVLELGGKDPMLVLDDADLEIASSGAVWGAFVNAGQTCLSVERCYVHRSLYDRFLE